MPEMQSQDSMADFQKVTFYGSPLALVVTSLPVRVERGP